MFKANFSSSNTRKLQIKEQSMNGMQWRKKDTVITSNLCPYLLSQSPEQGHLGAVLFSV